MGEIGMNLVLLNTWVEPFKANRSAVACVLRRLALVERLDWVTRDVSHPENVAQHTDCMIKMVIRLARRLPELDLKRACQICFVHEWLKAEADEVGEIAPAALLEFEGQSTPEGSFAFQLDMFQAMEKAWLYQRLGYNVRTLDFIERDERHLVHPVLLEELMTLRTAIFYRGCR
jgi:hypothetical protein